MALYVLLQLLVLRWFGVLLLVWVVVLLPVWVVVLLLVVLVVLLLLVLLVLLVFRSVDRCGLVKSSVDHLRPRPHSCRVLGPGPYEPTTPTKPIGQLVGVRTACSSPPLLQLPSKGRGGALYPPPPPPPCSGRCRGPRRSRPWACCRGRRTMDAGEGLAGLRPRCPSRRPPGEG